MSDATLSPLMRQFREIKQAYPDAIVFFRVGDFYEMFYEDALEASQLLSIALTSRDKNSPHPIPLCGVPYHAATGYIAKLLNAGRLVALCEQVEDPKSAKGLVRREVVRLYTPGTLVDTEFLIPGELNYLAALAVHPDTDFGERIGLASLEVSTGEFWLMEFRGAEAVSQVLNELSRLDPRELIFSTGLTSRNAAWVRQISGPRLCERPATPFDPQRATHILIRHFRCDSLESLGCQTFTAALGAAGAVLEYFRETQPNMPLDHIRRLSVRENHETMHLDGTTIRNLELLKPLSSKEQIAATDPVTLLTVLDHTVTAMGCRLLRQWLVTPLLRCDLITARLDAVEELKDALFARTSLRRALREVQDIARLGARITLGLANPRELLALKQSLAALPEIFTQLTSLQSRLLVESMSTWDGAEDLYDLIEQAIRPDAPPSLRDGNIIKEGYAPDIDELRKASKEGKEWIAALEGKERERTKIESLKVRYNQVFGYYIEITKANLSRVPPDYSRKQTLVNAERFTTTELQELEERVVGADVKLLASEQEAFVALRSRLAAETSRLDRMATRLALVDVLAGLAETAALYRYSKPTVTDGGGIIIKEGRHPVVERLCHDSVFVPNDTKLDLGADRLLIMTGPNMAGKSTYLRQVALIVLMAQIGSFVPATEAHIGVADRIFTRVGASDNLAGGQSTFMVEMVETASILRNATQRSLLLLDEIGRGTSTFDGLSLAWAIAEHIHDCTRLGARTLFATHYHEMTQLESQRSGIKNYRVAVQERDGDIVFLRKIIAGKADRSYGIHVAKLAGLPPEVVDRAQAVLSQLERPESSPTISTSVPAQQPPQAFPQPHPMIEEVKQIDLFSITPLDAMNCLAELQRMARTDMTEPSASR